MSQTRDDIAGLIEDMLERYANMDHDSAVRLSVHMVHQLELYEALDIDYEVYTEE